MHPLVQIGLFFLAGYWLEQQRAELQAQAAREQRRLKGVGARRSRSIATGRKRAIGSALAATKKMIEVLKDERRAAAQARDRLPWGSQERERAHELVAMLSERLGALYQKKAELYNRLGDSENRKS